jgi:prevent-host-death family protein
MQAWQMQEAKARLSELIKRAQQDGPQDITSHGKSVAVVLSRTEFDRLTGGQESFVEFMRRSPLYGCEEIELERDRSLTREIEL